MSRATSLKALVGNLRFLVVWKTWAALVVFGLGVVSGEIFDKLAPIGDQKW